MKTFKDLQIGDKIFIHFGASFIRYIDYKNGYLILFADRSKEAKKHQCLRFHIPNNHLNANKIQVCNMMIHLTKEDYKKYMNQFIKSQIEL